LNQENSKLFVGGYPDLNLQNDLKYNSFEGEIEGLRIGDEKVGLWNFVDGQNNKDGAQERNQLITPELQPTGYRFASNGYVELSTKPYSFKQRSNIQFNFKASQETSDGLMFYTGQDEHFISVELKDGGVYFQYKLGQHLVSIGSEEQYNDDKWHRVEVERNGRAGTLKIDGRMIRQEESPVGTEENLKVSDSMYFGGYPNVLSHTEIVRKNFDGCIDDVFISGTPVNLSRNLKAYDVRAGCISKFSSTIAFSPRQLAYLHHNISISKPLRITLKFKTRKDKGLIFMVTNINKENTMTLTLEDGMLVLRSKNAVTSTNATLNDGEWHHVSILRDENEISLSADNTPEIIARDVAKTRIFEDTDVYFGGLPANFPLPTYALAEQFTGCISDAYINGQIVNFADSSERNHVLLDSCTRDIIEYKHKSVSTRPMDEAEMNTLSPNLEEESRKTNHEDLEEKHNTIHQNEVTVTEKGQDNHEIPRTQEYLTTSTTVRPTKRRPNKEDSVCKLPTESEPDVGYEAGYLFGTIKDSRIEYTDIQTKLKKGYDISLEFKTDQPDGVLFYAADSRHTDFIVLYMKDGFVFHTFNCGSGSANMSSKYQYNNSAWHTVIISRQQSKGKLLIDGEDEVQGESIGSTRVMSLQAPYSFGGVSPKITEDLEINSRIDKDKQFRGCIRNIQVGGRAWGSPQSAVGVIPCSEQVESGVFFSGGFIKLRDRFKVGNETTISFDIKPRTMNGLLLSVHGKKAMFALQLINGTINFTVDNGGGPITAVFQPESNQNFCDGEWHTVTAIKSLYVITLIVDSIGSTPTIGEPTADVTDTSRPLFLGGHQHLSKARGLTVRSPFIGCIRNVKINEVLQPINLNMAVGKVRTGVCPLT